MVAALGLEVRTVTPSELEEFDGLALVDVQPPVFGESPPARVLSVDTVIDHHPERGGYDAVIRDIRTPYGATSTILTEYVRAAGIEMRPRLATALLYGIKSDTQLLGRETSRYDIRAFAYLHAEHSPRCCAASSGRRCRSTDCARSAARSARPASTTASTCSCSAACART
jgi:nanoRNase/pAp phosphatase (c-di-AMP/oligoRNAs hydrolase)